MHYFLSGQFEKSFSKLPKRIKTKTIERFKLFIADSTDTRLNNHNLSGRWNNYRSINITGDIRAIYTEVDKNTVRFVDIGSHSKLYQ